MGLVSAILTAPLAPVRVVFWVGDIIQEQVDHEMYDPGVIRGKIQETDEARAAGQIDPAEADELQRELIGRLIRPVGRDDNR
ncbi:gas vesicle protein GvpG [Dactylosporangium sp. CA-233914]|uniref:gas vesicle protein GvpG n=1 Tax=Dactylosporangium sp. CA-233914 TaxID=3239934 RepID=UPI003D9469CA